MKVFTITALLFLALTIPVFSGGQSEEPPMMDGGKMEAAPMNPYIEYQNIKQAMMLAEEKPTVLFFNASWCPSCKSARSNFEKNADRLADVNLVMVDYDHSEDLQKKYGVTYQHTFVQIDPAGKSLVKWNGGGTDELLEKLIIKEM